MIPTMIVFGLLTGRWWKTSLVLGTVGWAAVLSLTGAVTAAQIPAAALFGLVNTGVGVAIHQGVLRFVRRQHRGRSTTGDPVPTLVA
jgi:hypothetical protein